jgi:hypothetical protein
MQNDFSKLTLSTLTNELLYASYIQLVIFLSILFNFFYKDCIFSKYHIFQLLAKKRCGKKNSIRKF